MGVDTTRVFFILSMGFSSWTLDLSTIPRWYLSSFNGKLEISPFSKLNADDVQEIFVSDEMRYQRGMVDKSGVQLEKPILKIKNTLVVSTPNRSPRIFGRIRIG